MSAYAASKGGLEAMMRSFARELGPRGINVNAVAPGMVATELTLGAIRKLFGAQIARDAGPLARGGDDPPAQHLAGDPLHADRSRALGAGLLLLASPAGAEITGQTSTSTTAWR